MTRTEANAYRRKIETAAGTMPDSAALSAVELFPAWEQNRAYTVSERVRHGGTLLYRCVQAHTSQAGWTPDAAPALWVRVSLDEYPEWVQPTGAHDAYSKGDKVSYNGSRYVSSIDGNTYAPDVYGWEETA